MELEERGYGESDKHICQECVSDPYLASWIFDNASATHCDFCGAHSNELIAASFEDFTGLIIAGLQFYWNEPVHEGISYNSAEGGWMAPLTETLAVLEQADISENWDVLVDLGEMIDCEAWVPREFYRGTEREHLNWGWNAFKAYTKHHTRYFFQQETEDEDSYEIIPARMLDSIAHIISSKLSDQGLITKICEKAEIIRIRVGDAKYETAAELGSPPTEFARQSNRMSPAGIPMFYGAFDEETAVAETVDPIEHKGKTLSVATFRPTRELVVLNLATLPPVPSIFDSQSHNTIHALHFLHDFARDFSRPIARDGQVHIEYVPTQIVTEYFRRVFRTGKGHQIDGIVYASSKSAGAKAVVLFCENNQCAEVDELASGALVRLKSVIFR